MEKSRIARLGVGDNSQDLIGTRPLELCVEANSTIDLQCFIGMVVRVAVLKVHRLARRIGTAVQLESQRYFVTVLFVFGIVALEKGREDCTAPSCRK